MNYLVDMMLEVLKFFYAVGGHNYGLAIIWLTIAVNVALYPLTLSSIQQMAAMQKVQPKVQELQKKHKDDPTKLQKEMMDLYKVEGVNPLGGCLPVLLKLPFFLTLFWALQSKEFTAIIGTNVGFIPGWINDITKPDHLFVLPIMIGVSTWLSQKSMPQAPGQSQMMLYFMPLFIAFISYNFAAGVQIYWIVSNMMGWAQQAYIMTQKIKSRREL